MTKGTRDLVKASIFLAFAVLLPTVFHFFKIGGQIFLPMHLPVLVGGFVLPWKFAGILGFIAPFLSFLVSSMPQMPGGIVMMFELAAYGAITSTLYRRFKLNVYISMVISMLSGRLISIAGNWLLAVLFLGKAFNFVNFLNLLLVVALPGIVIQLIFIPVIVRLIEKSSNNKGVCSLEQPEGIL